MKRSVDGTAIRQDRPWQTSPIGKQGRWWAPGTTLGIEHQHGVGDGSWARVETQMRYKTVFGGRLWYSYSLQAFEQYPCR